MSAPYYADDRVTLYHGDCLDVLRTLPDASVDSVVTDPPYGLEFMGKEWDGADGFRRSLNPNDAGRDNAFGRTSRTSPEYRTTSKATAGMAGTGYTDGAERRLPRLHTFQQWCEAWATECLRVLKPGGHLLAFGGTRTWHRLACAVEDAGIEREADYLPLIRQRIDRRRDPVEALRGQAADLGLFDLLGGECA